MSEWLEFTDRPTYSVNSDKTSCRTRSHYQDVLVIVDDDSIGQCRKKCYFSFHFISVQFCFVLFPMHTLSCGETRFSNLASVLSIFQKGEGEKWLLVSCICARWFLQKGITHHTMIITVGQTNNVYSVSVYIQLYPFCVLPFCFWLIHPSHRDHLRSRRIILDDSKPV